MQYNHTALLRFWKNVYKTNTCWEWTGWTDRDGYGRFRYGSSDEYRTGAHNFSYYLHFRQYSPSLYICHKCDNPSCVNPKHLFIGTPKDNVQDMLNKGRANKARGKQLPQTKLSIQQVLEIRENYDRRVITMLMLADKYGVSKGTIQKILERKAYTYV